MENLVFGILTVLLCSILFFLAWKRQEQERYDSALRFVMVAGLLLRIFTATDLFLHPWDERYHALVAKNMIEEPFIPALYKDPVLPYDYQNWSANHVWLHKQPLPLWTMAISMALFGCNEIALRLPSVLISTLGIWLCFSIAAHFFSKRAGIIAAFLFSINGLILELVGGRVATDHIDVFFLFFIALSVHFSILQVRHKRNLYLVLAGLAMGAAVLSKWLPALIVLPIWFLVNTAENRPGWWLLFRQSLLMMACAGAVFIPWQVYIFQEFPLEANWEASFNAKHITTVLEGRTGPAYYYLNKLTINYGELIILPLFWFLWLLARQPRDLRLLALLAWIAVPIVFFSFAKTKMQAYILFISPALFAITGAFWVRLREFQYASLPSWLKPVLLILLLALPVRYSLERAKPFEMIDRSPQWARDLRSNGGLLDSTSVLFNYPRPIEAMFYTDATVYAGLPGYELLDSLHHAGFKVYINEGDGLTG
jgi:4-amino-4-deoxy-L-arabinose transferase-like glycosyltransferase